jgi:hypothetical protein
MDLTLGLWQTLGPSVKLSRTPSQVYVTPPVPGEPTTAVLMNGRPRV